MMRFATLVLILGGAALLAGCHEGHVYYHHGPYDAPLVVVESAPHVVFVDPPPVFRPRHIPGPRLPEPRRDWDRDHGRHEPPRHRR
jgi:hypothetical protein